MFMNFHDYPLAERARSMAMAVNALVSLFDVKNVFEKPKNNKKTTT